MSIEFVFRQQSPTEGADVDWRDIKIDRPDRRFTLNGETMGTRYSAVFYAPACVNLRSVHVSLQTAVDVIDERMSTWKPESELCCFNRSERGEWFDVSADTAHVVAEAMAIERMTGGAFDIGVGDLVNAWGFGPVGDSPVAVDMLRLSEQRRPATADNLDVDLGAMRLRKHAPLTLDLSGIAKGYGVDCLARCLDRGGIGSYLVSIDGELRAKGLKPDGDPWGVAIERPVWGAREIDRSIGVTNCAIATSGDYRRRVTVNGQTLSHTMNRNERRPLVNRLASVTVAAPSCMKADAWATALMVLGEAEGPETADRLGLDALFFVRDGKLVEEIAVGEFW